MDNRNKKEEMIEVEVVYVYDISFYKYFEIPSSYKRRLPYY